MTSIPSDNTPNVANLLARIKITGIYGVYDIRDIAIKPENPESTFAYEKLVSIALGREFPRDNITSPIILNDLTDLSRSATCAIGQIAAAPKHPLQALAYQTIISILDDASKNIDIREYAIYALRDIALFCPSVSVEAEKHIKRYDTVRDGAPFNKTVGLPYAAKTALKQLKSERDPDQRDAYKFQSYNQWIQKN